MGCDCWRRGDLFSAGLFWSDGWEDYVDLSARRATGSGGEMGWAARAGDAHFGEAAGGADYDGREAGIRMGGLGRGGRSSRSRNCFSMGGWEAADGGDGNGGQGAGEVIAFEDGRRAVDGAEEGGLGYSASCTNAGD